MRRQIQADPAPRPMGATALAVLFGFIGAAGIVNGVLSVYAVLRAVLAADLPGPQILESSLVAVLGLCSGVLALAFACGLWTLKSWAIGAYAAWLVCLGLLTVLFLAHVPLAANVFASTVDLAFGLFAVAVILAMPWVYASKLLQKKSPSK